MNRRIPKQKRSIEKVERIMDCAEALMHEKGVEHITTHLVAARAGIAVGSLYQFFPNIETVKMALIERVLNRLYLDIMSVLQQRPIQDLAELSEVLINATIDFYQHQPGLVKTILAIRNTEAFEQIKGAKNEKVIAGIASYIHNNHANVDLTILTRKIKVAVMLSDLMTMLVWTTDSEQERQAIIQEWKQLSAAYALTVK